MRSSHGNTPAGWAAVIVILLGAIIAAFGVGFWSLWLSIVGGAVVLVGGLLAPVLQRAGLGQYPPQRSHSYANAREYLGAQREESQPTRREDAAHGK